MKKGSPSLSLNEAQVSNKRVKVAKIESGLLSFHENEISTYNVQGHPDANYQRFTETTHGRK